jgi:hypothetical protein
MQRKDRNTAPVLDIMQGHFIDLAFHTDTVTSDDPASRKPSATPRTTLEETSDRRPGAAS